MPEAGSKIDASPGFLPVAVTCRVGSVTTADLFFRTRGFVGGLPAAVVLIVAIVGFGVITGIVSHAESMPEVGRELYRLISAHGADVWEFLQGQLTQDLELLRPTGSLPAAWCNARGRVHATTRLLRLDDGVGLIVPESMLERVVRQLTLYRLRADVAFEVSGDDWHAIAVTTAPAAAPGVHAVALAADAPACEVYGSTAALAAAGLDEVERLSMPAWQAARIQAGLPDIVPATSELYTPHMLNLDLTGAVSFNKGCYTGQEVVARTQNLGRSRRRLLRYQAPDASAGVGDKLVGKDGDVGTVVNASGADLLAVAPVALRDETLSINGQPCEPAPLPYEIPQD